MASRPIEKVHPKEEHYYLEALGTRQDMQSKGIGSSVIRHMLDRCDAEGMPAHLESSNVRNVPFYARHGFEDDGRDRRRQRRTGGHGHVAHAALNVLAEQRGRAARGRRAPRPVPDDERGSHD